MHVFQGPSFREEVERYRLVFTCEGCRHFCPQREACAVSYPTEPHRQSAFEGAADGERLYFCKMFEPA